MGTRRFSHSLIVLVGTCVTSLALATGSGATIGEHGLDLAGRDLAVKPGDDFYRYAGGTWLKTETLPADRTSWTSFSRLAEDAQGKLRGILEEAAAKNAPAGSTEQKIGDYYSSYLDADGIEAKGATPAAPILSAIASASSHEDVARFMARAELRLPAPIDLSITLDEKNPDRYVVSISHGGLGLPDRDFYLRDDEQFKKIRAQYQEHIARLLTLGGQANSAEGAAAIVTLETEIAKLHWPRADRRDRDKTYNARSRADLVALAPAFPWDATFDAAGLGKVDHVVVSELSAMKPLGELFRATPVSTWRTYLTYHYLRRHAALLPKAFDDEVFAFYDHTLSGQPEQRARWKRAVSAVDGALGEAVGKIYVEKYFPAESKKAAVELVENLRAALGDRIRHATWMTAATKEKALGKLAKFRPKIGYPDHWRDYSALEVRRGDAFGNATRAMAFEWQRELARLDKPTDRDEWYMSPQTINAYYNPIFNEIVFPAAILQPPFFDPKADAAVNYGGIGGVIGHEMGHGFDDQGAKSDANGVLHDWWKDTDVAAFKKIGDSLATQYGAFEPLPGIKVNGRLTLGENLGDLGGLSVAYVAYHHSLHGKPAPVLEGVTGDQRFFLAWAQVWRALYRDETLRNQVLTDPHSPNMYRTNGIVRNVDAWYKAFDVKPGDAMYLPPADRVHTW
jgi:putative endopeptidase